MNVNPTYVADRLSAELAFDMQQIFELRVEQITPLIESPIEALFVVGLEFAFAACNLVLPSRSRVLIHTGRELSTKGDEVSVIPQFQWRGFRIDFAVFLPLNKEPVAFVECDGHAFHERTPEQAERDRSRDREIQSAGIPVFRFTGRELHRNPYGAADEIMRFLDGKFDRHARG